MTLADLDTREVFVRETLRNENLQLYAQPVLDLASQEITQFELLVRLCDGFGGVMLPTDFVKVAEQSDLIHGLDRWVLKQAIRSLGGVGRDSNISLAVNLSCRSLTDRGLLDFIEHQLASAGASPERLIIELTETAPVGDLVQAREFIDAIRHFGCRFGIDDYGAGFDSAERLQLLPADFVKIDGRVIRNLLRRPESQALVGLLCKMANSTGFATVAEYVENQDTLRWLECHGVDYAQGFHIGRPRPLDEVNFAHSSFRGDSLTGAQVLTNRGNGCPLLKGGGAAA